MSWSTLCGVCFSLNIDKSTSYLSKKTAHTHTQSKTHFLYYRKKERLKFPGEKKRKGLKNYELYFSEAITIELEDIGTMLSKF